MSKTNLKTTVTLSEKDLYLLLNVFEWALSDLEEDDDYSEYLRLARRFEKAQCRLNGIKWKEKDSYY